MPVLRKLHLKFLVNVDSKAHDAFLGICDHIEEFQGEIQLEELTITLSLISTVPEHQESGKG